MLALGGATFTQLHDMRLYACRPEYAIDPNAHPASFTGILHRGTLTVSEVSGSPIEVGDTIFIKGISTNIAITGGSGRKWTVDNDSATYDSEVMTAADLC